jgi:hypothetical protein
MIELPLKRGQGVIVTVRLLPEPPKTMFVGPTSAGLDEVADNRRLAAGVSASPIVKGMAGVKASSATDWFAIAEIEGASFTGLTNKLKLELDDPFAVSVTVIVITADPN